MRARKLYAGPTMSHLIAGIDESLRPRNYLLCATVVSTADRGNVSQVLRGLLLPGQRRLHAKTESKGRRRTLLKTLSETPGFSCHIAVGGQRREGGRERCLHALASHLLSLGVREILIERVDDGTARHDRETMLGLLQGNDRLSWRHEAPEHEPLLWISDMVVSAFGAGGDMRRATESVLSTVISAGSEVRP